MTKAYDSITLNNNGVVFPGTRAINATGPTAFDGTERLKETVDDVWLNRQAELDFYNSPPNGLDDLAGVAPANGLPLAQPLIARYMNYGAPGVIVPWCSTIDPAIISAAINCDIRILLLNGQGVDRTTDDYKLLDILCYVGNAANPTADSFYRADDAAGTIRNIAGQYLILPDMRGYSLRGLDPSGVIDPDGASRIVGSVQEDAFQGHWRDIESAMGVAQVLVDNAMFTGPTALGGVFNAPVTPGNQNKALIKTFLTDGVNGTPRISSESRAKNVAVRYGMYY